MARRRYSTAERRSFHQGFGAVLASQGRFNGLVKRKNPKNRKSALNGVAAGYKYMAKANNGALALPAPKKRTRRRRSY